MMISKKIYIVMILFLLIGCSLEHKILINMNENNYQADYIQTRDLDLIPFLFPDDLKNWVVVDSSEIDLHHQRKFNYSDIFPSLFTINKVDKNNSIINDGIYHKIKDKEIILREPYQISTNNLFILKNYQFSGTFKSRRVADNYDKLINYYSGFMDDAEKIVDGNEIEEEKKYNSISEIFNQLIGFLYIEAINNSNVEFNQKGIYLNALKDWKNQSEINSLINEDKIGLDSEQLSKILGAAEEYLYRVIDDSYIEEVKGIWEQLELEVYGTLFLLFNEFYIEINMPGNHVYHNADSISQNTLLWNIDVDKFLNDDFEIIAKSRVFNISQTIILLILLLIIIGLMIKRKYLKA